MPKNIVDIDRDNRASDRSRETNESGIVSRVGAGLSSAASGVRSLFSKKHKPRHQRSKPLRGVEDLEGRMLLSTFSSTSTLGASEVVWTQGKDEANGIVGVGNFLPGTSLYDTKASPDGSSIITSGRFGKSSVVDAKTGATLVNLPGHGESVIDAAWSPDGSNIFTASYDRHVRQFSSDGNLLWDSGNVGQLAVGVDVSPDGGTLFIRRHEAPPMIVDLATKNVRTLPDSMKMVGDMDALEDGNVLYMQNDWERLRGPKNRVFIVDAATGNLTWEGSLSGKQPTNTTATPNGQFIFAGIDDGSIVMFDRTKGVSSVIAGASSYLRDMTMDATGTMLVIGTEGGLRVYDVEPLMTGSGAMPEPYVFPVTASSVTVSGSVAFVNNIYDNSSSRTIAIDLGKVPNVLKRLIAKETAVSPKVQNNPVIEDAPKKMVEVLRAINFSQLTPGELTESKSTGKTVRLPLIGDAQIFSGGFSNIRVMQDGSLATGLYEGHLTLIFKNPTIIDSITVQKFGNGISKYNLGSAYIDLGAGETTIPVGYAMDTFRILVGGQAEAKIMSINIKTLEEAPAITPIADEQEYLAALQAKLDDLLAHPETTEQIRKTVIIPLDATKSGMIEGKNASFATVHNTDINSGLTSGLQVGQQYWIFHNVYFEWRSLISFDLSDIPDDVTIDDAVLSVYGARKLNVTNENMSLNVVGVSENSEGTPTAFKSTTMGAIDYGSFAEKNRNTIKLSGLQRQGNGRIELGLRLSQDVQNQAPSRSGNNAYVFYLGDIHNPAEAPTLQLTYSTNSQVLTEQYQGEVQALRDQIDASTISDGLLETVTGLVSEVDTLTQPWTIGENDRLLSLTKRASELRVASSALVTLLETLESIDDSIVTEEQRSSLLQGLESSGEKLLTAMQERDLALQTLWDAGISTISPNLQEALLARASSVDDLRLLTTAIDLSGVTRAFDGGSIVRDELDVLDAGGTIKIHGLQGRADTPLSQRLEAIDGETVVKETGQALAVDFSALSSPIVQTAFTVTSSEDTDIVKVSFLSGSSVSEVQMVTSGETVSHEDADGITGVMIENVRNILSADAEAYQEYLRTYQSNYMYSWQDPGPRHHFFNSIRKDLKAREGLIVAEVDRVKQIHPVSIGQLSVTSHTGEKQETSMLSGETNALYAKMSVPEVTSFWFPNNRFSNITSVGYNKDAYNVYSLRRFSSAAGTLGIPTYVNAADEPRQLPKEFYKIIGDAVVVFPSGQDLRIGIGANSGTAYGTSLRVGQNYDYEVLSRSGASLADVLPSSESRVGINDVTLFTVNQGGDAGWHEGASLEYSTASPVAVGTIKARARIENTGGSATTFTVNVYSGNVGIAGWDRVQQSYKGSLAAGDSRALVTNPLSLNTDSQGRSFIRFVVASDDGRILAEGGRTVGAAGGVMSQADNNARVADFMKNWEAAIVKAQAETKAFFVARGETVPAMGDIATFASRILEGNTTNIPLPDPATTERQMRLAFRALDAAKTSGNAERIALEQARFDRATAEHIASTGFVMVTPGAGAVKKVSDIVTNEEAAWKTPTGKLERAERELLVVQSELLASVDKLTEVRIGGVKIDAKDNITLEKVGENLRKLSVADNASAIGNAGVVIESGKPSVIELTITEDKMVSVGNLGRFGRNVNLTISGGSLPHKGYPSTKSEGFGDSVSLKLTPGTYTVTLDDVTNYNDQIHSQLKNTSFTTEMKIDVQKYNSANINGLISVEGRRAVMPVSMRVAEFIPDGQGGIKRNTDYQNVSKLKPDLPVWVVVHGMNDSEKGGMEGVARELRLSGMQVVTIDWEDAANSILILGTNAPWTKSVGEWVAARLIGMGFNPADINFAGHSHGTYVGYAMANKVMDLKNDATINAFVGLDPAGNIPLLSGFRVGDMDFGKVSRNATAIEGSLGAGNNSLAATADIAFQIDSSGTHWPQDEHPLPVSAFANLLVAGRSHAQQLPTSLLLSQLMTSENQQFEPLKRNQYRDVYEGIITVVTREMTDSYGNHYDDAILQKIISRQREKIFEDIDLLLPLDEVIR